MPRSERLEPDIDGVVSGFAMSWKCSIFKKFPQTREAERGIHAASTHAHQHA